LMVRVTRAEARKRKMKRATVRGFVDIVAFVVENLSSIFQR
jgi:hypothetical protein